MIKLKSTRVFVLLISVVFAMLSFCSWELFNYAENGTEGVENSFAGIKLPDHMIKGATYTLPDFDLAEVYVKKDGNDKVKVSEEKYVVDADTSLEFFYETEGQTFERKAAIVDVGYGANLLMDKFFTVEDGDVSINSGDSSCVFGFADAATVQFINFIDVSDFTPNSICLRQTSITLK